METPLTKKEAVRLHRILWNTIADILSTESIPFEDLDVVSLKEKALYKMKTNKIYNGDLPFLDCFCCEYEDDLNLYGTLRCNQSCPIRWSNGYCGNSEYILFDGYLINGFIEDATKMAKKIANLPERPDQYFDIL